MPTSFGDYDTFNIQRQAAMQQQQFMELQARYQQAIAQMGQQGQQRPPASTGQPPAGQAAAQPRVPSPFTDGTGRLLGQQGNFDVYETPNGRMFVDVSTGQVHQGSPTGPLFASPNTPGAGGTGTGQPTTPQGPPTAWGDPLTGTVFPASQWINGQPPKGANLVPLWPAQPAQPATPATPGQQPGQPATPATPAQPAQPPAAAQPTPPAAPAPTPAALPPGWVMVNGVAVNTGGSKLGATNPLLAQQPQPTTPAEPAAQPQPAPVQQPVSQPPVIGAPPTSQDPTAPPPLPANLAAPSDLAQRQMDAAMRGLPLPTV